MGVQNIFQAMPASLWWILATIVGLNILVAILRSPKIKGAMGEWFVSRILHKRLPEGYIILDDVYLPLPDGSTTQIDHIVVSPYGIFVVETKNYSGWIFASAESKVWTQTIYRKKSSFQNPMRQNYLHVCAIANNLGIDKTYIKGVVAFIGGCTFKTERPEGVVYSGAVADYVRKFRTPIIKQDQVGEIAEAILEWQSTLSKATKASHVKNIKARHHGVQENAVPKCPRCGAPMILRTAKSTGRNFFGCSNYPKCRSPACFRFDAE
jgi:restriction system protein